MHKRRPVYIRALRLILYNQIAIMTALWHIPGMPKGAREQLSRIQEDTADFLEETR